MSSVAELVLNPFLVEMLFKTQTILTHGVLIFFVIFIVFFVFHFYYSSYLYFRDFFRILYCLSSWLSFSVSGFMKMLSNQSLFFSSPVRP